LAAGPSAPTETYKYQDPFGNWRTMTVPAGMAKYYYSAQNRKPPEEPKAKVAALVPTAACPPCTSTPVKVEAPSTNAPKVARLQDHPGLHTLKDVIGQAATVTGVDRFLISAVIAIESGFQKDARSPKGALGLMQLMPQTAVSLVSVKNNIETALVDPATNVGAGARHLKRLIDMYPGRLDLALAAYNAGEGSVAKYAGIPPFAETQAYVRNVMALYQLYEAAYAATHPPAQKPGRATASRGSATPPSTWARSIQVVTSAEVR
jgi:soluble lytic murein transglycosylase-like protein